MAIPDILVIGGGVIGAACARSLAMRGLDVVLLEPGPLDGAATPASAGMLVPLVEANRDDPMLGLAVRARDLYAETVQELEDETNVAIGYWRPGVLRLAFDEQEEAEIRNEVAWKRQQGFAAEWLTPQEALELAPGTNPAIIGAGFDREDGALDPAALRAALLASAIRHGTTVRSRDRARSLATRDGRVTAVRTDRRAARGIRCGSTVLAAGAWSAQLEGLPRPLWVEPLRGQMVACTWPASPPAIVYGAGVYVVERHGEALIGATVESVGFDTRTTDEGIDGLLAGGRRVYPALQGIEPQRRWAGLRPGTPDGRPVLGADGDIANLWYATGHGRNGILLAALTGQLLTSLVLGEEIDHDLSPVHPMRFAQ